MAKRSWQWELCSDWRREQQVRVIFYTSFVFFCYLYPPHSSLFLFNLDVFSRPHVSVVLYHMCFCDSPSVLCTGGQWGLDTCVFNWLPDKACLFPESCGAQSGLWFVRGCLKAEAPPVSNSEELHAVCWIQQTTTKKKRKKKVMSDWWVLIWNFNSYSGWTRTTGNRRLLCQLFGWPSSLKPDPSVLRRRGRMDWTPLIGQYWETKNQSFHLQQVNITKQTESWLWDLV